MLNQVLLIGRLAQDVEIRETPTGKTVTEITLAVRREYRNSEGNYDTDFFRITLWDGIAQNCKEYCQKGQTLFVKGRMHISKYDVSEEKTIHMTEIVGEKVIYLSK